MSKTVITNQGTFDVRYSYPDPHSDKHIIVVSNPDGEEGPFDGTDGNEIVLSPASIEKYDVVVRDFPSVHRPRATFAAGGRTENFNGAKYDLDNQGEQCKYWASLAQDTLLNRKIIGVAYIDPFSLKEMMWSEHKKVVVLTLFGGMVLIPFSDPEGNSGGTFWGLPKNMQSLIGKRIVKVEYRHEPGWADHVLTLELDNGLPLVLSSDAEGNGPGTLCVQMDKDSDDGTDHIFGPLPCNSFSDGGNVQRALDGSRKKVDLEEVRDKLRADVRDAYSKGFTRVVTGWISPKRKGVVLINADDQVWKAYHLVWHEFIRKIVIGCRLEHKKKNVEQFSLGGELKEAIAQLRMCSLVESPNDPIYFIVGENAGAFQLVIDESIKVWLDNSSDLSRDEKEYYYAEWIAKDELVMVSPEDAKPRLEEVERYFW